MKLISDKVIISIILTLGLLSGVALLKEPINSYLKIKAINDCSLTATVSYTNAEEAKITEPYKPSFDTCLRLKGYEPR